ncbi:MAG: response regulator [Pseudomonadota bacterium]
MNKPSILIVDDEKDFADAITERLRVAGYESETCYNAKCAWNLIKEKNYDVVIQDLVMPEADGITSMHKIKAIKPLIEIIVLSGQETVQMAVDAMKEGAFEYLEKPCEMAVVISKIQEAYQRKYDHEHRIRKAMERAREIMETTMVTATFSKKV